MIDDYNKIAIPDNIDFIIEEGVKNAVNYKLKKRKSKLKIFLSSVAALCLSTMILGAANPSLASRIPIIKNVFEYIEKDIYFPQNFSEYSTSINKSAYSNGVSFTISEILCDGDSLYISYIVKSDKPFKNTSWNNDNSLDMNQLIIEESYNKVDFTDEEVPNTGLAGLEGKFIDEYTFVGFDEYHLNLLNTEIPDEFTFQTKICLIEDHSLNSDDESGIIYGTWAFKIPVKVDRSFKNVIDINESTKNNNIKINSISITPFSVISDISFTNAKWMDYRTFIYDENDNELGFNESHIIDNNTNKTVHEISEFKVPYNGCKSFRIVVKKLIKNEPTEIVLDKTVKNNKE